MHDTTLLDVTHDTLRSLTSKLLGGYAESEMTGVLACRHSGVWLWSPSNGKKIIACRGMLTGKLSMHRSSRYDDAMLLIVN